MKLYKVLGENGEAHHGGVGQWNLPDGDQPGEWMPEIVGTLEPCENGYHACREQDLILWLGPRMFELEYEGKLVEAEDKVVVRKARLVTELTTWNKRTARLFACDCAERALSRNANPDSRSVEAIAVARCYANGEATDAEWAAAWAAAWDAAGDAAWAAAWAAAWDAAGDAAWDARDAAGDAAWAAAWAAAWDAAGDAAWDARDAEQQWQTERLFRYLNGEIA